MFSPWGRGGQRLLRPRVLRQDGHQGAPCDHRRPLLAPGMAERGRPGTWSAWQRQAQALARTWLSHAHGPTGHASCPCPGVRGAEPQWKRRTGACDGRSGRSRFRPPRVCHQPTPSPSPWGGDREGDRLLLREELRVPAQKKGHKAPARACTGRAPDSAGCFLGEQGSFNKIAHRKRHLS